MYTYPENFPYFQLVKNDPDVQSYIRQQNASMRALHYTEHSFAHITVVARQTQYILISIGKDPHTVDLALSAAWLHDIGNVINRVDHSQSGAIMAFQILNRLEFKADDIAQIICAIGNHDEGSGVPVSDISAALILADKSDVRRTRVQETDVTKFDIHDRVNYSVYESSLTISPAKTAITLALSLDTSYSEIAEYFEIFMDRMLLCKRAANYLHMDFDLVINNQVLL